MSNRSPAESWPRGAVASIAERGAPPRGNNPAPGPVPGGAQRPHVAGRAPGVQIAPGTRAPVPGMVSARSRSRFTEDTTMHDVLRQRLMRHIEALPEERLYHALDYVEFLASKYA